VIAVRVAFLPVRLAMLTLCVAGVLPCAAVNAAPAEDDMAIAQNLAEMLRDARTVISDQQDLINDPELGDKRLTGDVVLEQTVARYTKAPERTRKKSTPPHARGVCCEQ
jgi:hypothetical protein